MAPAHFVVVVEIVETEPFEVLVEILVEIEEIEVVEHGFAVEAVPSQGRDPWP